ncbi:unnamed protein product [Closterium sp. Naga37s-1]|nr:unnamed protein product [Closterium sp. Naga37s-1]
MHSGTGEGGGGSSSTVLGAVTRTQLLLAGLSGALVLSWLVVSGHWLLKNALAFVSHVRLPNVKPRTTPQRQGVRPPPRLSIRVCALLLACLFLYDIFWVFFSHRFFGANVMLSVATQHAHNPAHSVSQPVAHSVAHLLPSSPLVLPPLPFIVPPSAPPPAFFFPLFLQVCALLLACLFLYDIFWVFFSHRFFGANVMLSVATQHAHNPAHSVAHSLHLPSAVAKSIVREIELPVKLLFPRDLFGELNIFGRQERGRARDFMVLGLGDMRGRARDLMVLGQGDMAIPGMLLALVLCVDQHKRRQQQEEQQERELEVLEAGKGGQEQHQEPPGPSHSQNSQEHSEQHSQQQQHSQGSLSRPLLDSSPSARERGSGQLGYVWVAALGYAVGLVAALAAGVLTRSPQPALLYLVPSTLGPVSLVAWSRGELADLWDGSPGLMPFDRDKLETLDV